MIESEAIIVEDEENEFKKLLQWNNYNNQNFYENISAESLSEFACNAGLTNGCDISALKPYWENAETVLDVGAGYGRNIQNLLKQGYQHKITALERSTQLYKFLHEKHQQHADLILTDLHEWNPSNLHFDAIFFLWSGLADFSKSEQPLIIQKLASLLNRGGVLLLDTMPMNVKPLQTKQFSEQSFLTKFNNNVVYTYEPTTTEIIHYAKLAGLTKFNLIHCKTDTKRIRWLYVLQNS